MTERQWRKSSHSGEQGDCVEVAFEDDVTYVRDSKDPEGGEFKLSRTGWQGLLAAARNGRLDRQ